MASRVGTSGERRYDHAIKLLAGRPTAERAKEAKHLLLVLAEAGHSRAQVALGTLLVGRDGGRRDFARAFKLYRSAARRGDVDAYHNLGQMYWWGDYVRQDRRRAVFWFARAAQGKHPRALFRLAEALTLGIGVRRDANRGAKLMRAAARLGDPDARRAVAGVR